MLIQLGGGGLRSQLDEIPDVEIVGIVRSQAGKYHFIHELSLLVILI